MSIVLFFFFFNDTATTEIYTLSLHDALPIFIARDPDRPRPRPRHRHRAPARAQAVDLHRPRSEEHTSELQSPCNLVCRLLLEKKNNIRRFTLDVNTDGYGPPKSTMTRTGNAF